MTRIMTGAMTGMPLNLPTGKLFHLINGDIQELWSVYVLQNKGLFLVCRYVRVMPSGQSFNPIPIHIPFHDGVFPQMLRGHQGNLNYGHPLNPAMSPYTNNVASYTPWPNSPVMNYAQSLNGSDTNLFRFAHTKLLFNSPIEWCLSNRVLTSSFSV